MDSMRTLGMGYAVGALTVGSSIVSIYLGQPLLASALFVAGPIMMGAFAYGVGRGESA